MLTLFTCALAAPLALDSLETLDFDAWSAHHNKSFAVDELSLRRQTFNENRKLVMKHNAEYRAGRESWYMALNAFAAATPSEFAALRATKYDPSPHPVKRLEEPNGGNPERKDWRDEGAVTEVKNQGGCGSCWAFSATETVESMFFLSNGEAKLPVLAPQVYVDCVKNPKECGGTGGCEGATMELAFNLTVTMGLAYEADVPYKGRDEECPKYRPAVKAKGYVKNPVNDYKAFETALATMGPQSITVAAEPWQLYGGGVFDGCSKAGGDNTLDHGVQAVGYTADYWIVRKCVRRRSNALYLSPNPCSLTTCANVPCVRYSNCAQFMGQGLGHRRLHPSLAQGGQDDVCRRPPGGRRRVQAVCQDPDGRRRVRHVLRHVVPDGRRPRVSGGRRSCS